jgi:DNA-binding CsgD family transcriptional regulator
LENRDEQRKKIADQVMTNFDQLVFPYYQRIRHSRGTDETDLLVKIMEKNTLESLAPLERSFPMPFRQLTPMEIQVADLIKMGKSSKEISGLLNISTRSVFFHRNNIRKKLNIHGKKVNLRSFLISSV